jgi:hypothetical protein
MHLVGFIIRKFVTMHGHLNVKERILINVMGGLLFLLMPGRKWSRLIPEAVWFPSLVTRRRHASERQAASVLLEITLTRNMAKLC